MNTNTEAICNQLRDFSPYVLGDNASFPYYGICLYAEASEDNSNSLIYVTSYSEINSHKRLTDAACFVCIDDNEGPIDKAVFFDVPTIILKSETTTYEVFNLLLQNFFKATQKEHAFKDDLLNLLADGASLTAILQEATRHFVNPFVVFDNNFSVVAHSISHDLDLDVAQRVANNRYANVDVLQKLADSGEINLLQHSTRPRLIELPSGYKKLAVNLFDGMDCVGLVCFYNYVREFEEADYDMVAFVAKLVGSYFHSTRYTSSVWTPYDYVFNYLLTTKDNFNPKIVDDLKISFPSQMRLMIVNSGNSIAISDIPLKFIENSIKAMLSKSHSYIHSQTVLFLCPSKALEQNNNEHFFKGLTDFLRSHHLFAGISNSFSNLSEFRKAYSQALFSASLGLGHPSEEPVLFYVEHTISHMLSLLSAENDLCSFYHPAFTTLIEYDRQYNTQYTECLMVYLRYNGNMAECANYFSIHYNSIKYRMKVIQDICKVDLHDINTFIHLYLSYMIMEFYGRSDDKLPHA